MLILLLTCLNAHAAPRPMPLFETMLEERAFVTDLRATISVPTVQDHLRARKDWPLSAGLCHRIEREVETQFADLLLHLGHFYDETLPDLPRVLMRLNFEHRDMDEAVPTKNKRAYTRVLNGILHVTWLASGREVGGIPLRFVLTRDAYGEYDTFRALKMIDLDGVRVTNGPLGGKRDTVRYLNEGVLLEALFARDGACGDLL